MSMSQEEIEALMNGLDINDDEQQEEVSHKVNTEEIEQLLSQKDEIKEDIDSKKSVVENKEEDIDLELDLDNILLQDESENHEDDTVLVSNDDIDDLLKDIDNSVSEDISNEDISDEDIDNFENLLEETITEEKSEKENNKVEEKSYLNEDEIVKSWTSCKINEGVIPLPAEKDTKVVNQLSQVANDSEEKVSQIFDVLSLSLDNNNILRTQIKDFELFIENQSKLLNSLNAKFPNISVFNQHLAQIEQMNNNLSSLKNIVNDEDNQIFQAMELMQFNDINRQKIERVMSVIRKLSLYLNNLFEDDNSYQDIAIAKHIPGDESNDLIGDDLDKLIADFNKDK